ncbi:MAG: AMP-binding protein, partial [Bacteroidota bacterium]
KDRLANHAPIHFDISTLGYFTAPLVGASTVILSDAHTILPGSLGKLIEAERFSIWYSVPLALTQLLQSGILEQIDASSLRWVLYAGEAFPPKYLRALMEQWSHSRFGNIYGPAEVNQCTYYHLPKAPEGDEPIPIGYTWGNTEYLILDEEDQEVPVGTMGELLIRSATMMSGYWQKPDLTARSLYRKKTATGVEAIYYRTGDLFKLGEDGLLHFFGRKDAQVKVRGYRVELDAIEVALVAHQAIAEAAVFTLRNAEEVNTIQAAVILNPELALTEKEVLQYLKSQLPFYAIPENIHIMDSFPRTSSGKISRPQIKAAFQVTNS